MNQNARNADGHAWAEFGRLSLFIAVFALVFFRFWSHSIIFRDSFNLYAPLKHQVAEALRAGEVHLWNPNLFLGLPGVGDILAGWFYPLNLIYVILPFERAHTLFILIHYLLAAVFMDRFLRGRGLSAEVSFIGGLTFALCGHLISQHSNLVFLIGATWAPLAIQFIDRAQRDGPRWAMAAAAAIAMPVLGGDPQSALVIALVALLILFHRLVRGPQRSALTSMVLLGVFCFGLCAVQVLPTLELMRQSTRAGGLGFEEASLFSFHPARLIEFCWPTPLGTIWPDLSYWGRPLLEPDLPVSLPWSITNYLGLPMILLALYGLTRSPRKWKIWPGIGMALFLVLAFGRHTPVFKVFHGLVPLFDRFRYPEKHLVWFSACTVIAAALGLEAVKERLRDNPGSMRKTAALYLGVTFALMISMYFIWLVMNQPFLKISVGLDEAGIKAAAHHLLRGGLQVLFVNLAAAMILFLAARGSLSIRRGAYAFAILVLVDLTLANVTTMSSGPRKIFEFEPSVQRALADEVELKSGQFRIFRENLDFYDQNSGHQNYQLLERYCLWERDTLKSDFELMAGLENIAGYHGAALLTGRDFFQDLSAREMERLNVRYIISDFGVRPEWLSPIRTRVVHEDEDNGYMIYELPAAWPRAYWVPDAVSAESEAEASELLKKTDPRTTVVLTTSDQVESAPAEKTKMKPAAIRTYRPDLVELEVDADAPGWLVLSDRFYPGWRASVDGKPVKIYQANLMVRAVPVEAGSHLVRFRFRPPLVVIGGAVSLAAWLVFIGGAAALAWKARAQRGNLRTR